MFLRRGEWMDKMGQVFKEWDGSVMDYEEVKEKIIKCFDEMSLLDFLDKDIMDLVEVFEDDIKERIEEFDHACR